MENVLHREELYLTTSNGELDENDRMLSLLFNALWHKFT